MILTPRRDCSPCDARRRAFAVAGVVALAVALGACSQDLTEDDLVEAYQASRPSYSADVAECVVAHLVESFGVEGVEAELDTITSTDAFEVALYRAEFDCGETGDVEGRIVELLLDRDLDPEAAECVAADLVVDLDDSDFDVLLSGEITDQFFDKYYTAIYDCDALPG